MGHTVGQVAALAGVTVRALHHYDAIGLLPPSGRGEQGYRLYDAYDLDRLRAILTYRDLGLSLEAIGQLLEDGDHEGHLRRQAEQLRERIAGLQHLLEAVTTMLEDDDMTAEDRLALATEARERWGDTDAYKTSERRTQQHSEGDWARVRDESEAIEAAMAEAMAAGEPATGERAMDLAEQARQHISRWFYDCPPAMHRGLGDMYVADPRFTEHYDRQAPGLAPYVREAIHANAARATSSP